MPTAIVTSKGQITIPQRVRERLGIVAGDRVGFVELASGQFALIPVIEDVRSLKGMVVPRTNTPVGRADGTDHRQTWSWLVMTPRVNRPKLLPRGISYAR